MKDKSYKKTIVFGIIIILISSAIFPGISTNIYSAIINISQSFHFLF